MTDLHSNRGSFSVFTRLAVLAMAAAICATIGAQVPPTAAKPLASETVKKAGDRQECLSYRRRSRIDILVCPPRATTFSHARRK